MKDCSLKICLNCEMCDRISVNTKGWWHPFKKFSLSDNTLSNCFSHEKGENYGPTDICPYKFEHTVLGERKGFKLNSFEDFNELYEAIKDNNFLMENDYHGSYSFVKRTNLNKDVSRIINFGCFRRLLFSTNDYLLGNFGKILIDEQEMKFVKHFETIDYKKELWLNKFSKKRKSVEEKQSYEKKHKIVFPVAGVTFEERQEKIKFLSSVFNSGKRMEVEFEPEPTNIYDSNAIKVLVLNNGKKEFVGYVPKTLNKDQDNESKIENFNAMISNIIENIEKAETSWIGEKNGNYGIRVVCYEKVE